MPVGDRRMRRRTRYLIGAAGVLVAAIGIAAVFVLSLPQFGGELTGERLARARANPHYRNGAFVNPLPPASYRFVDAWNLFKGQFFGDEVRVPARAIPVVAVDAAALKQAPPERGLRAFWIGHARG